MKKIFLLSILLFPSLAYADGNSIQTRFGLADGTTGTLVVARKPTKPAASSNGSMLIDKITQTKDADYILLTSIGGTACPASFSIVKITKSFVTPTAFFGNCDDRQSIKVIPGKSIIVSLPKFQSQYKTSAATTITYDIPTGKLKENGKPLKTTCENDTCEGF